MGDRSRSRDRRASPKKRPSKGKGKGQTEQTAGASSQEALLPGARNPIRPAGYYLNLLKFDYDPEYHSESEEAAESRRKVVIVPAKYTGAVSSQPASRSGTSPPLLPTAVSLHLNEGAPNLTLDSDSPLKAGPVEGPPKPPPRPTRKTSPRPKSGSASSTFEAKPKQELQGHDASSPPSEEDLRQFIDANGIDHQAADFFYKTSPEVQAEILSSATFRSAKNPSAVLMKLIRAVNAERPASAHAPWPSEKDLQHSTAATGDTGESESPQKQKTKLSKKQKKEKRLELVQGMKPKQERSTAEAGRPKQDWNKGAGKSKSKSKGADSRHAARGRAPWKQKAPAR